MEEVIVWSKPSCPNCEIAKNMLEHYGINYNVHIVGLTHTREQLMAKIPDARSVPQIQIDGKVVSKLSELETLLKSYTN